MTSTEEDGRDGGGIVGAEAGGKVGREGTEEGTRGLRGEVEAAGESG